MAAKNDQKNHTFLSFGSGTRFLPEDTFLRELESFGFTRRSFRALCRRLNVPLVEFGRTRLVNVWQFQLAMCAISRIGQPNFYAPGGESIRRGSPVDGVTELNIAAFRSDQEAIIEDLLTARKIAGLSLDGIREVAKRASDYMIEAALRVKPNPAQLEAENEQTRETS